MKPTVSEGEFVEMFEAVGATEMSHKLGVSERNIYARRTSIESKLGISIKAPGRKNYPLKKTVHGARIEIDIENGVVLVGSDAHYWPGEVSTAHRAFVRACRELKPVAVIMNGDLFDGASISRHPPIGWETRPTVIDEIGEVQTRLREIEKASRGCKHIWTLGNHDARFETRLATVAPEFAHVHGVHLKDHFPDWETAWSVFVNGHTVIKHRFRSGTHAPWNNTLNAGTSIITGHLHSGKVMPMTDYRGTRYGVDAGCLARVDGEQFVHYTEDNPKNWRSGFAVLTFRNGRLTCPELVLVWDEETGEVEFRGKVYAV